jgi:hypothetical protein
MPRLVFAIGIHRTVSAQRGTPIECDSVVRGEPLEAIADRVGQGGLADRLVPRLDRKLGGQER